jgi:glycosyltransferase involved in cell wall biosynthesis
VGSTPLLATGPGRRTLVVIPTYDEVETAPPLIRALLDGHPGIEVLVVDDASPDGTADAVEALAGPEQRVRVVRRSGKLGIGSAHLAGFRFGLDHGFDRIFTMDADGSHAPEDLGPMLEALDGHDMVIGSRYMPGGGIANWPLHRRLLSRFANWYTRTLLELPYTDCTSGYRGYRRSVLEADGVFSIRASGYSFLEQMVWRVARAGFSITERPIRFVDRRAGRSKIETTEIFKAALDVLAARRILRAERRASGTRAGRAD